jgi:hypothetical protein
MAAQGYAGPAWERQLRRSMVPHVEQHDEQIVPADELHRGERPDHAI